MLAVIVIFIVIVVELVVRVGSGGVFVLVILAIPSSGELALGGS